MSGLRAQRCLYAGYPCHVQVARKRVLPHDYNGSHRRQEFSCLDVDVMLEVQRIYCVTHRCPKSTE